MSFLCSKQKLDNQQQTSNQTSNNPTIMNQPQDLEEMTRADSVWECANQIGLIVTDEECIQAAENANDTDTIEHIVAERIILPLCNLTESIPFPLPAICTWTEILQQYCAFLRSKTTPECGLCEYIESFKHSIEPDGYPLTHMTIGYWIQHYFRGLIGDTPFRDLDTEQKT